MIWITLFAGKSEVSTHVNNNPSVHTLIIRLAQQGLEMSFFKDLFLPNHIISKEAPPETLMIISSVKVNGGSAVVPHGQIDYEKNILSDAHRFIRTESHFRNFFLGFPSVLKIVAPLNEFLVSSIRFCPFNWTLSNVLSDTQSDILRNKNNVLNVLFDLVNMIINGPNGFSLSV